MLYNVAFLPLTSPYIIPLFLLDNSPYLYMHFITPVPQNTPSSYCLDAAHSALLLLEQQALAFYLCSGFMPIKGLVSRGQRLQSDVLSFREVNAIIMAAATDIWTDSPHLRVHIVKENDNIASQSDKLTLSGEQVHNRTKKRRKQARQI